MNWEYEYNRLVESALKLNDIVNHLVAELEIRKGVAKVRQERIDKAIELTENLLKTEDGGYYQILFQEQLKVLRGEDKE